jgi:hypothetical protein
LWLGANSFVQTIRGSFVQQIEPSPDALSIEEVVKLFNTAFEQICGLREVDKLVLERFRIIFQAAKDYGSLLAKNVHSLESMFLLNGLCTIMTKVHGLLCG